MHNRLSGFIDKHNILFFHQFGFQKHKSTSLAILDICNQLVNAIESKQFSCCIFLDFAKAFDTVNHDILLNKLEHYGIQGIALKWLRSYLKDRTQRVSVGGTLSKSNYNNNGVPQGSVLELLLFLLYINDIPQSLKIMNFHLFADDTSLFYSNKNIDNLEETVNCELAKISDLLIANKLTLNVNKTNFIIIKPRQKKLPRNVKLNQNGEMLKESDCVKYLGVLIDKNLSWKNHIKHVTTKVAKSIGILSKIRHFAPKRVLINVFNAFIYHINYSLINWGGAYPSSLDQLNKCLKKATRTITFKPRSEPSKPILKELYSLNLEDTYKLECAKFIFEISKGNYNSLYSHLFQLAKIQHNINTRQATSGKFCTPM